MICAGIDYSYTCPSIAIDKFGGSEVEIPLRPGRHLFYAYMDKPTKQMVGQHRDESNLMRAYIEAAAPWETPEERYDNIANWAIGVLKYHGVQHAFMEDYALSGALRGGLMMQIAENAGALKMAMFKHGIPFTLIGPSSVKKEFTGNGRAKKIEVFNKFNEVLGIDLNKVLGLTLKVKGDVSEPRKPAEDIADSLAVLMAGIKLKGKK